MLFTLLPRNSLNSGSVRIIGKIGQSAQAVKVQNFIYLRFVFSLTAGGPSPDRNLLEAEMRWRLNDKMSLARKKRPAINERIGHGHRE